MSLVSFYVFKFLRFYVSSLTVSCENQFNQFSLWAILEETGCRHYAR